MRRRDNINEVRKMGKMLTEMKKLTLENYILPEEDDSFDSYEEELPRDRMEDTHQEKRGDMSDIEKELIEIRKIALSVINRLADQTSSESYDTMKRIWSLVDKAIESKNTEMKNNVQ